MRLKRIIFGDFHGHFDSLNQIYQDENPYEVIHLGDYFDNFSNDVEKIKGDFEKLLTLREQHLSDEKKGDFVLLLGNHDFHYLLYGVDRYSGYNTGYDIWAHQKLQELYDNNQLKLLDYDYSTKTIYSHAGITNTWLKENRMDVDDFAYIKNLKDINLYTLRFTYAGGGDWYGDSIYSSPIWVRPNALLSDMYKDNEGDIWTQIVGHTNNTSPIVYYPKKERIGNPRAEDYNFINTYEQRPILWVMDCMPKYYLREWINEYGKVLEREIVKNDKYNLYKPKKY